MKTIQRKVHFYRIKVKKYLSLDEINDPELINGELFSTISESFEHSKAEGNMARFCHPQYSYKDPFYIISSIKHEGGILYGVIGQNVSKIDDFIRERISSTNETKSIGLSSPDSKYEKYTYFAISAAKKIMVVMNHRYVYLDVENKIAAILSASNHSVFTLEVSQMYEGDIKKQIEKLGNNISIKGNYNANIDSVSKPSLKQIARSFGVDFDIKVSFKAKIKELTRTHIDNLPDIAEEFSSLKLTSCEDDEENVVDLITRKISKSETITIEESRKSDDSYIWGKLAALLNY